MECLSTSQLKYSKLKYLVRDPREIYNSLNILFRNNEKLLSFLNIKFCLHGFYKDGTVEFETGEFIGAIPMMSQLNIQIGDFYVYPRFLGTQKFQDYGEILDVLGSDVEHEKVDSPPLKSNIFRPPLYLECISFINSFEKVLKLNWRQFDNVKYIEDYPNGQVNWNEYAINKYKIENTLRYPVKRNVLNFLHDELSQLKHVYELSKAEIFTTTTPQKIRQLLSSRLIIIDKILYQLKPRKTKNIVVKASDNRIIKNCKIHANNILNGYLSDGIAWRVDFNKVFEKFVEYIFKKTAKKTGGTIFDNKKFHSRKNTGRLGLSYLEPDVVYQKEGVLFFVDAKYKSHFYNRGNIGKRLGEELRADQHQIMAYSSFSTTKNKFSILCYPSNSPEYENREYVNPIEGNINNLLIIGIPISIATIDSSVTKISNIINFCLMGEKSRNVF